MSASAACVAVIAAVLFVLGPANTDHHVYEWAPARGGPSLDLLLNPAFPLELTGAVPCDAVQSIDGGTFFSTGSDAVRALSLSRSGGDVVMSIGARELLHLPLSAAPSPGCSVSFEYDDVLLSARLAVAGDLAEIDVDPAERPEVAGLTVDDEIAGSAARFRIDTYPTGSSPSRRQWVMTFIAIVACAVGVTGLVVDDRMTSRRCE